ncbi:MAG: phosphatase PAP2 family protein [Ilumatobacteraceae bacterium]
MKWPTWQQGAITAIVFSAIAVFAARSRPTRWKEVARPAAVEIAILAGLYSLWRIARTLPLASDDGAIERGRQIDRFQHWLHLPSELSLQHLALGHDWFGRFLNYYYAIVHVPATLTFLVWLYVRHRDVYPHWRNGLAFVTGSCLFIRFVRVAPPRFLPDLGYIDLAEKFGWSVYGPVGTGVSDQFAAMPSIHVGWAAVVALGAVAASTSRWRWVVFLHLPITMLAVSGTGNHWWLDGIVAIVLLWLGLWLDTQWRRRRGQRSGRAAPAPMSARSAASRPACQPSAS